MVGLKLNEAKSVLEPFQDIQFLGLRLCPDQGRAFLPIFKAQEIIARACRISSQTFLFYREVSQFIWEHSIAAQVSSLVELWENTGILIAPARHVRAGRHGPTSSDPVSEVSSLAYSDYRVLDLFLLMWELILN